MANIAFMRRVGGSTLALVRQIVMEKKKLNIQLYCVAICLSNLFIASFALYWPAFHAASSKL